MSKSDGVVPILFLCIVVLSAARGGFAQGSIGVFATSDGARCNLYDTMPGSLLYVHVVQVGSACATGGSFRVTEGGGFSGSFGYEVPHFDQVTGSCRTGMSVLYGTQRSSPTLIVSMVYYVSGASLNCSWIRVIAHPDPGGPYLDDCSQPPVRLHVSGGMAMVNPDQNCRCSVNVEPSTWGAIKTLY
jgi:hypothetical protein